MTKNFGQELKMTQTGFLTSKSGKTFIRIYFSRRRNLREDDTAEGIIPGYKILKHDGFSEEEIAALDAEFPVERIKLVATDGATRYMRELIDAMDDDTFSQWIEYHFAICERQDLIGASHHTLDILRKR